MCLPSLKPEIQLLQTRWPRARRLCSLVVYRLFSLLPLPLPPHFLDSHIRKSVPSVASGMDGIVVEAQATTIPSDFR